jgi:formylglycine-generating enzyme required for sulfatase activity
MIRCARYVFVGIVLLLAGAVPAFPEGSSEKEDVIFFRNGDILRGRILNESLRILTPYALVDVPLPACAGVSFNGPEGEADSLFTVNFNRFTGKVVERTLRFRSAHARTELMIRKEKIQRIRCGRNAEEDRPIGAREKTDLFVMANGDLLTGRPGEPIVRLKQGRDEWEAPFSELRSLEIRDGKALETLVRTLSGETIRGSLETEAVSVNLDIGAAIDPLYLDQCSAVFFGDGNRRAAEQFPQVSHESMTVPDSRTLEQEVGILTNSIGMKLKRIEPGTFLLGANRGHPDEAPRHWVELTEPYCIGVYEVTQGQWEEVMGSNPSYWKDPLRPVETVSWNDARWFCRRLSELENREYRLPTEAEWAYACRAGTSTAYPWGEDFLEDYSWCSVNARETTHEVGTRKPNPWGLHDMSGNIWEWCEDAYGAYPGGKIPVSDQQTGTDRVLRGGGWYNVPERCRAASRNHLSPDYGVSSTTGFRVVTGACGETEEKQGIAQ